MGLKIKPIISKILIIFSSVVLSLSFIANILLISFYFGLKVEYNLLDYTAIHRLESEKFVLEKQLAYESSICEIQTRLPNTESFPIYIEMQEYDTRIPLTTDLNPYPSDTEVYEIGIVTSSTPIDIDAQSKKVRVYRIELSSDPSIYIDYISHKDNPYLYILKDSNSSEFLLYPLAMNKLVQINTAHYIVDSSTITTK